MPLLVGGGILVAVLLVGGIILAVPTADSDEPGETSSTQDALVPLLVGGGILVAVLLVGGIILAV
ncbi:hypothetical protein CTI14_70480, partial [Methylobacterium radiotolerans]